MTLFLLYKHTANLDFLSYKTSLCSFGEAVVWKPHCYTSRLLGTARTHF